jgi:hypothetical protein
VSLIDAEHRALTLTADLADLVAAEVIGHGPTRAADLREFAVALHVVQNMILAQSAAHAHPALYRALGDEVWSQPARGQPCRYRQL